jgi:hypothetical protein
MDRVYKSGGTGVAPNAADNASGPYPRSGDAGTGTPATKPGPFWFHMITEEIAQLIEAAGLVLAKATLTQLRDAVALLYDSQGIDPGGRLTLTTAVPVTTADVAGAASHFYTPHRHNRIKLYDGTRWKWYTFAELTQAANDNTKSPAATEASLNYDVFVWDDAGTVRATRGPKWTAGAVAGSDTARGTGANSTELEFFEGRWVNKIAITNGPAARRGLYVGSIRSDGASQFNDTAAKRHVWNTNGVARPLRAMDGTNSWTYTTATLRQANGSAANQVDFLIGLVGDAVEVSALHMAASDQAVGVITIAAGIGLDATNAHAADSTHQTGGNSASNVSLPLTAHYRGQPGLGRHFLALLEYSSATGTTTWYGDNAGDRQSGLTGTVIA